MAALDLKDLKLFENGLEDVGDAFDDVGDKASDASKTVEEFEKRIYALLIKANPMPRLVKDINDQLGRQAEQMRQTLRAADELAKAYDRLTKSQGGLKQGPKFGSAAKSAIDKSPMDPPEPPGPPRPVVPRDRPKTSAAGGLTKSEAEALGGTTIDAVASLAKGDEPLKVMMDLGKDVAKALLNASLEGISLGTELKRMGVSAGVIRVIGQDAAAAKAGLSVAAAATGELTVANVAMGEAAMAAGAAEAIAIAPLGVLLAGVALAAAAVGTVFAVTAQQIGKSTGENLDHLHLTEDQLARVKDKGVTMGDVLSGVWKTTSDMLQEAFGPALQWLGEFFGKVYQGAVDGVLWLVKSNVQAIGGFLGGFKAAFGSLGPAIADLVISGLNIAGDAIQKLVNKAIDAINHLVRMGNGAAEKLGLSIRLPELSSISIAPIENQFAGKAAALGKDIAKGVTSGASEAGKALDALGDRIVKNTVKARDARVIDEAGKAIKDAADAACNCGSDVRNVANDNRSYRSGGGQRGAPNVTDDPSTGVGGFRTSVRSVNGVSSLEDDLIAEKLPNFGELANNVPRLDEQNMLLSDMISHFEELNKLAPELGNSLEKAFGAPGKALTGVISAAAALGKKLAEISLEQRDPKNKDDAVKFARQRVDATVSGFAEMSIAAKGFFDKNSSGYAALQSVEKAYRAWQFAQQVQAMAREAAETVSSISKSMAKGAASTAAGAAKMFEMLGPFAFPAVAAMVALLAGFGLSGGGGASVPGTNDMKTRQETQGSGSVLGDSKAKSESLEKALTHAQAYENKDLEYGNAMVRSLKSIDDQIGAVAAALARSFGAGGMLSTEGLNLGKAGSSPTLSNLGFSKSTTRTLQDQGIQFDTASLGDIVDGNLSGSTYQQVLENTKKKAFGITTSNKSKVITETGALDVDFLDQVGKLIGSLGKGVADAAKALGATDVEATLAKFKVDLGKLSFKDMTGAQIEEALNAVFSKLGDDMAKAAAPTIAEFQKVGEGAFETLVRVARQYEVIDTTLKSVGMKFGEVGVASLGARERLVELVGGLDNLTDQAAFFGEHFLTEDQRLAPVKDTVKNRLTELQLPTEMSRDDFKGLVLKQNLSTKDGAELYAALMALAPAFDKVATAAETARTSVEDRMVSIQDRIDQLTLSSAQLIEKQRAKEMKAAEDLGQSVADLLQKQYDLEDAQAAQAAASEAATKAAEAASKAAEEAAKAQEAHAAMMQSLGDAIVTAMKRAEELAASLRSLADELLGQMGLGDTFSYGAAKANLVAGAQDGEKLEGLIRAFLDVSKKASSSTSAYQADVAWARGLALAEADRQAARPEALANFWRVINTTGFATGGSFEVGGSGAPDSKLFNLALSPGEMVNVRRPGAANDNGSDGLVAEIRALREEVAELRRTAGSIDRNTSKMESTLTNVTEGGRVMLTEAAS